MLNRIGKGWEHDPKSGTFFDRTAKAVWSPALKATVDVNGAVYKRGQRLEPHAVPQNIIQRVAPEVERARKFFNGGGK